MGGVLGPMRPTTPAASRARASAPTRCPSRSWASAPSQSRRRSPASRARRIESIAGRSPGGASRQPRARCLPRSRVMCGAPRERGYTMVWEARRSRGLLSGAGRVGRARDYSIMWSARPSTDGGMVSPSALAVLRLTTRSNLVGCSTGRSAGLAPLRILAT
jgi:hypothetical protein